ncbi:hypothetical protein D0466_04270 [Peribacillus glennii]|uniref:Uncharacterized protein n=1 Tax=Peribacillus glennii TaxID=2303991 RepID=A0A372LFR0_9BACI|nr:hypothetical protein D0466_04270 [Peribacillus glennii]
MYYRHFCFERSQTIQTLIQKNSSPKDFTKPGHISDDF